MNKIKQKILLFFLFSFSIYCALIIGQSWDEGIHLLQGKITLDYLFSLGNIDKDIIYRQNYSPIYWSLKYIVTEVFPSKYQIEVSHIVNLLFSIATIIGFAKINKILFNKEVSKISFLILFFYPIFFGHMAINSSDIILAFSHIWIIYLVLRYFEKQNIKKKANKYIFFIGLIVAMATGVQLVFLGSLIPFFLFIFVEIFFLKKIISKTFSIKKFFYDFLKSFLIFYGFIILFWIDVHSNIILLPFTFLLETFSVRYWTGWPYNLIGGNYYLSNEVPKSYLLINLFYKTPEYILITYLLFILLIFKTKNFFIKKFKHFNYKILLIILILIFPNLVFLIIPYAIYDGIRLFLWTLPYFCIIPALTIYCLIENFNAIKPKLALTFLSFFIIYYLFNFFSLTPYQYTYLNFFNGNKEKRYQKFENDYWATSIKELIKYSDFEKDKTILIATCGASPKISENYFKKRGYFNLKFIEDSKADYIIMTNRTILDNTTKKITNCFEKFKGTDVTTVERNGLVLSVIRKIKS